MTTTTDGAAAVALAGPAASTWRRVTERMLVRTNLRGFVRVVDRPTRRRFGVMAIATTAISLLEVAALLCIAPLAELLSGKTLGGEGGIGSALGGMVGNMSQRTQTLVVLGLVVGLLVGRAILSSFLKWWTIGFITAASAAATRSLLVAYLGAPLAFHSSRNSATSLRTAAISLDSIFNRGLLGLSTSISESIVLVIIGMLLAVVTPLGALAAVVYFGLAMLVFNRLVQRRSREHSIERERIQARWLALLQQILGGLREIRLRGAEREYVDAFAGVRQSQVAIDRKILFSGEFARYFLEAVFMIGFGVLAAVVLLTQGDRSASVLAVLLAAGFRLLPSATRLLGANNNLRVGQGSLDAVIGELDAMGLRRLPEHRTVEAVHVPTVNTVAEAMGAEFRHASFWYPGAHRLALEEVSGIVPPGSSLGIVGPSGAGKSTAVDLLCGLIEPTTGEVFVDGCSTTADDRTWQRRISYVPQDVFLLDASLRDNIAFTTQTVDDDAIRRALRLAQLEPWAAELPHGLETSVGERGVLLSGGQRQRIGLARALYRNPSLLILDEATSALDVETEAAITSAIDALDGQLTVIVVAHRLSTVRRCGAILLLDDGRPVGWGSFDELARTNRRFADWVELAGMSGRATEAPAGLRSEVNSEPQSGLIRSELGRPIANDGQRLFEESF